MIFVKRARASTYGLLHYTRLNYYYYYCLIDHYDGLILNFHPCSREKRPTQNKFSWHKEGPTFQLLRCPNHPPSLLPLIGSRMPWFENAPKHFITLCWKQSWCSGERTRLPPMWPAFDFLTRRPMWVEFVGSLLCSESFFPEVLRFFSVIKNQHLICFGMVSFYLLQSPPLEEHLLC